MPTEDGVVLAHISNDFGRWEELLALIVRSFKYMDGVIDPPSSARFLTVESLRRKCEDEIGIVALTGEDLAGCAFLSEREDCFYVGKLAVEPALQGQGVGRLLLAKAEQIALDRAKPLLELQTRVELVGNQAYFRHLGFAETRRTSHPGHERPTSVTMRKVLG